MRFKVNSIAARTSAPIAVAMIRNFSIDASPSTSEPRIASGKGSGICAGPQTTLMSSSPMIIPPIVIRICFRCWP